MNNTALPASTGVVPNTGNLYITLHYENEHRSCYITCASSEANDSLFRLHIAALKSSDILMNKDTFFSTAKEAIE
jgi:hypothetical protein